MKTEKLMFYSGINKISRLNLSSARLVCVSAALVLSGCGKTSSTPTNSNPSTPPPIENSTSQTNPSKTWGAPQGSITQQNQAQSPAQPSSEEIRNISPSIPVSPVSVSPKTIETIPTAITPQDYSKIAAPKTASRPKEISPESYMHHPAVHGTRLSGSNNQEPPRAPIVDRTIEVRRDGTITEKTIDARGTIRTVVGEPQNIPGTGLSISSTKPLTIGVVQPPLQAKNSKEAYGGMLDWEQPMKDHCPFYADLSEKSTKVGRRDEYSNYTYLGYKEAEVTAALKKDGGEQTDANTKEKTIPAKLEEVCVGLSVKTPPGGTEKVARGVVTTAAVLFHDGSLNANDQLAISDNTASNAYSLNFLHKVPGNIDFVNGSIANRFDLKNQYDIQPNNENHQIEKRRVDILVSSIQNLMKNLQTRKPRVDCVIQNIFDCPGNEAFQFYVNKTDPNLILVQRVRQETQKNKGANEVSATIKMVATFRLIGNPRKLPEPPAPIATPSAAPTKPAAPAARKTQKPKGKKSSKTGKGNKDKKGQKK